MTGFVYGPVHGFLLWNLFLAVIPAALAPALFARRRPRGRMWWAMFGVWLLFLPNAPYVLTDIVHMITDVRGSHSTTHSYLVLATYGAFFAIGLALYVWSLQFFRRFLHRAAPARLVPPLLLAVHGLSVVAMYLGRVPRLNSWDVFVAPDAVARAVASTFRPRIALEILAMFVVVGAGAFVMLAVVDKLKLQLQRFRPAR